jgi:spore maturation protein CgeB
MIAAGWSPSVRLFEAAACAVPVVSDDWDGLDSFFAPGTEILIPRGSDAVVALLQSMTDEEAQRIGRAARARMLAGHSAAHRAAELERYLERAAKPPVPIPTIPEARIRSEAQ